MNASTTTNGREVRAWSLPVSPTEHELEQVAFEGRVALLRSRKAKHDARHRKDVGHDGDR
jgi:hypothetical protein